MTGTALLVTVLVGGVVGFVSGLLGIGGGVLIVPFLYVLLDASTWAGVDSGAGNPAAMAHATSLAVILPTALAGIRAHCRGGMLAVRPLVPLGVGAAALAAVGAFTASHLPSRALQGAFSVLLVVVGFRLLGLLRLGRSPSATGDVGVGDGARWSTPGLVAAGGGVGYLSALLGIGGGVVAIPLLLVGARVPVERVAGASLVVVLFAAVGGVLAYGLLGGGASGSPPGSWGYVFLPAAIAMVPGAVVCAPFGARLNHRLNAATLRRLFGFLLLALGARLLWSVLTGASA